MGVKTKLPDGFFCYTDWKQLPASADTLFACGEKNSLFFSRRWYENLAANALDDDQHLLLACVNKHEPRTNPLTRLFEWLKG